ncbi:hypothetical protein [Deinococcus humi]|uniref:Uncharacterized protein n=1 Tax=Deinococcus humi TaxID=662880 RepID=A0A7W8NGB5_9DEIO|nr:hypothetical protein [Deinococcus humi]MBB5362807.1 hypothetical protein [Deinococcus humi]GGO26164.1 hypothetical protein GCM10008949_16710 [Deinococcus humi]
MPHDAAGRWLLTATAALLFALGLPLLFAADVMAAWIGAPSVAGEALTQLAASGLLGLGVINWWWRGNTVRGIAGRPLGLGNFLCCISAGASLGRATWAGAFPGVMWVVVLVLTALALAFAWRMFVWRPGGGSMQIPGL